MKAGIACALMALVALSACSSSTDEDTRTPAEIEAQRSADIAEALGETEDAPAMGAVFEVTSSCENEWPVVIEPSNMELIATAQVTNVGDEAGETDVVVEWYPVGRDPVTMTKTVEAEPGATARVPFAAKPTQAEMNGMIGLQHGDEMCSVTLKPSD